MGATTCVAGHAFHVPTGNTKHVFVVTFDPVDVKGYPPQSTVCVSLSTIRQGPFDNTCILVPGCHRFVIARTYAVYRLAEVQSAAQIEKLLKEFVYVPIEPFDPPVVARLAAGILASPHTAGNIKVFIRDRERALEVAADKARRAAKKQGDGTTANPE